MDNSIGFRISQRRKELGITGQQIKDSTGISTGNLSGIEKGNSLPSAMALIGLSRVLQCSIDWILTGKSPILENLDMTSSLSEDDSELLETYHQLDRRGRHRVHTIIYEELDRMAGSEASASRSIG